MLRSVVFRSGLESGLKLEIWSEVELKVEPELSWRLNWNRVRPKLGARKARIDEDPMFKYSKGCSRT